MNINSNTPIKYFSLFSGIGGFEKGIEQAYEAIKDRESVQGSERGSVRPEGYLSDASRRDDEQPEAWRNRVIEQPENIGFSEIDKYATAIYQKHFPEHKNYGDITLINEKELPDFDLLCGGFPCQAFSIAGKRAGFADTRGTLFFDIARILKEKQPRLLLLENVKGLLSHDSGRTFKVILSTLTELGYDLQWQVLNSKNHGVPQNRERVFIVGHLRGTTRPNVFPLEKHEHNDIEKVYFLPKGVPEDIRAFLRSRPEEGLLREQVQRVLAFIQQGIQKGELREVPREESYMDADTKGGLQVIEELGSWTQGVDKSGGLCGVVQVPTEDVLLLWSGGDTSSVSFRHLQQQDLSFERGQGGLLEKLRSGESCPLLFAVQSHQGRLLYSIGDGRDWQVIHSKSLEKWNNTLSSILEEHPDPKYFLSEKE